MTVMGRTERKSLCRACKHMKPHYEMIHAFDHRMYCSKGCVAKAQWLFGPIPTQRKAID